MIELVQHEERLTTNENIGVQVPRVYLPRPGIDLKKWAVVACDQYTSEPDYWERVAKFVGDAPSTLHLTLPEIFLGQPDEAERVRRIQSCMEEYLASGLLVPYENFIFVERQVNGKTRHGLLLGLDLEKYDYNKGSFSLVRATEGTIIDRLPPRMKIRQGAKLELPHIMVLIDDPERTVIEPLAELARGGQGLEQIYDFELMMDGGHLSGYRVVSPALEAQVIQALENLTDPQVFSQKYGVNPLERVLLFAMGDGNHSLAAAKAVWEQMKPHVGSDHPARYALVEVVNLHDDGLEFEPIHRVLFDVRVNLLEALKNFFPGGFTYTESRDCCEMMRRVEEGQGETQTFGVVRDRGFGTVEIHRPTANLAAGTLQPFLDELIRSGQAGKIDYVHGKCVACKLSVRENTVGFYLPNLDKNDFFKTVILNGALPRKTFSMGEAREKRYYMEARRIA